jgi:hemoglobin-like flavoprotein
MTPFQIKAVQDSFARIAPDRDHVAAMFYERLFKLDARLKPLFTTDLAEQGRKLMSMLGLIVRSLENVGGLVPVLEAMGERHHSYGVRTEHYDTVGEALLWTLETGLGAGFTAHVRESWATAYRLVSGTMLMGAPRVAA